MHSSLFLLPFVATALAQASTGNKWHINSLQAGCASASECNYSFNVLGNSTAELPQFEGYCIARTMPRDANYRACDIKSSSGSFKVEEVRGYFSLGPESPPLSKLSVELKFNDGKGHVQWWEGSQEADYKLFHDSLHDFDIVTKYSKGVA